MTWPFDPYQTVLLLFAGVGALGGYLHVKFQTGENVRQLVTLSHEVNVLHTKTQALEIADAVHAGHIANIENLKETMADLRHELKNQRTITMQLERVVARLEGASRRVD